ncbi:hypothetical protein ACIODS_11705 [Micromonospora chalcea]|uniref:hypothetical protein n=1 Tax=Micromonospora chalcea TaxID=1874 RepID=UPI00380AA4EE
MTKTAALTRPNGKTYRPRKPGLRAHSWRNDDDTCGVIVFGTLDPERAHAFAVEMCRYWHGLPEAVDPKPWWYRQTFISGELTWTEDAERGAPGVMFTAEDGTLS